MGRLPEPLTAAVSERDHLRQLRNGVGHTFGRKVNIYKGRVMLAPEPVQQLFEQRLHKWLMSVDAVVLAVDDH